MVYQPPVGARDLFPIEVAQNRWIEDRLQQVFQGWGYHQIITSTLERIETLLAGGAIQPATLMQLQDREGQFLGLRPELTASIARAAATRLTAYPQRLYYSANVFRRGLRQESYQAGVELLGAGGLAADAEILLLLFDCLHSLELEQTSVILGEAGLTRSLLLAFPEPQRAQVRQAIARLDRLALEALPLSAELQQLALMLFDLRGQPAQVLQQVSQLNLNLEQRASVSRLKALIELLESSQDWRPPLILDLSLIQTFDYYTGIVFEAVSAQRILGQGGRYDQLLGLYHPQRQSQPGIGFVLNLEELHQVLLPKGALPAQIAPSDWLVIPATPDAQAAAFAYAQKLRESAHLVRVELQLAQQSPDEVRSYAAARRIKQVAWVDAAGMPQIESLAQVSQQVLQ
ncbi:MAG: ATP phosphoribosyltransferase regulatory subunit [Pegethrix bostrychoides GSE-TBD4-15B]|jgi:ATP phosphoribosyltransferase regulatory subunit|uniref:ATP phosphoribosyltransferase regulatory subunit n=1 Tax=Pegethrix bostrychoides GSE-TBD4-15B TaxID=2839662 RepID=A0A951P704_9CYAN|nr:ATP phosphoribosyltransferase regulatory subunit [Pegethrix bostrychoides GSE-TBD4-15B]